jgi:hypothetical protein
LFIFDKKNRKTEFSIISKKIVELHSLFDKTQQNIPFGDIVVYQPGDKPLLQNFSGRH